MRIEGGFEVYFIQHQEIYETGTWSQIAQDDYEEYHKWEIARGY